jgi:hypothetical protein
MTHKSVNQTIDIARVCSDHDKPGEIMATQMRLVDWRRLQQGKLLGFATVELPLGLRIAEVPLLRGAEGVWATLPGKPELDRDNRTVRTGPDGRPLYRELLTWRSRRLRQAFSERVVELVRAEYPDDLSN